VKERMTLPSPLRHPQDHVAIALTWAAESEKSVEKLALDRNPNLSVPPFGHRDLIDPRHPRLEGFLGLLSDRDADHPAIERAT
jgi:hypothetical protein